MPPDHFPLSPANHANTHRFAGATARIQHCIPDAALLLAARVFTAAIFFQSGQTKMDGWALSGNAFYLFQEEYRLPWLNPEATAYLTAFAEHLFPLLLLLGFATRLSALSLLVMTLAIQLFVYPDAWPTHGTWATLFLLLIAKGAGNWSVDFMLAKHWPLD